MAAPKSATCPADVSTGSATADVSVDMVNIDQVNGQLVNVQVSEVPPVSLTRDTDMWDPRIRVKKGKGKRGEGYWAGSA